MAERLAYLEAVVGADITQFRKSMRDIRNETGILSETISGIGGFARGMTFAFTAPMVTLGTYAVDAASKFDGAMRNINSILQLNEDQFAGLSEEVLAFARTTREGVTPATEALYEVFSAGITDQEKAMAIWQTSTKVAEAGLSDLSATTNAITATMSAYNLETDQATRVGNIWTRMVQVGVGSLDDFLGNAQKILPLSNALGVSLEDMGASVAFLSQGGGGARKAETAFAMMLSNLLKPTEAMKEAFSDLGVQTGTELLQKFGSVGKAIKALRDESDELDFNAMFSKTGLEAAFRMTQNFDQLTAAVGDFNEGLDTSTMDAWAQQAKSFDFQLDLMKSALGGLEVQIGQAIMPLITPLIQGITGLLDSVSKTNPELMQLGVIFVSVVAAAAPLVWLLTALINPFGLIIGAVVALSAAFATNFNGIQTTVTDFVTNLLGAKGLKAAQEGIQTFMDTLFPKDVEPKLPTFNVGDPSDIIKINPSGHAISLWEFYEGEGFIEKFSWADFQKMATDAGWDGTAIEPGDILNLIAPGGQNKGAMDKWLIDLLPGKEDMKTAWDAFDRANMEANKDVSIFQRITTGISQAWPDIEFALGRMWANFKTWVTSTAIPAVDDMGSGVITSIAGWFGGTKNTGGSTPVYEALHSLLNGDIAKAAAGVGTWFTENFPEISKALSTLVGNIGDWFKNDGLPTVARGIGYFGGRITALVGQVISSIWTGITSGSTGNAVNQAGQVFDQSIWTPLTEGFAEGQGDAGLTNPVDKLFSDLATALLVGAGAFALLPGTVTAIAGVIGSMITGLAASPIILAAVNGLWAIVFGGSIALGSMSMAVGGIVPFLTRLFAPIITTVAPVLATFTGAMSAAWASFMGLVSAGWTATTTWIAGAASTLWGAFTTALTAIAASPIAMGIVLGSFLYMVIPQEWRDGIHDALAGLIDSALGGKGDPDSFDRKFEDRAYEIIGAFMVALGDDRGYQIAGMSGGLQQKAQEWVDANGAVVTTVTVVPVYTVATEPAPMGTPGYKPDIKDDPNFWKTLGLDPNAPPSVLIPMPEVKLDPATTTTGGTLVATTMDEVVAAGITPETFSKTSEAMQTGIVTAMQNGDYDGQAIVDTLITPLATGFTTSFGAESPATLAWTTFVTGVTTGGDLIDAKFVLLDQDIALLATDAEKNMPRVTNAVLGSLNPIIKGLNDANFIAKNLSSTLAALDGATVTITTSVTGGVPVAGSHADGLAAVPYDGYIAELHKGERVLTADEAMSYDKSATINRNAVVPKTAETSNVDNSQPTFNFYEAMSFEDFQREAKKRGYSFEQYKR